MSHVYVIDQGSIVGCSSNSITVKKKDGCVRHIPIETVEGISVFGGIQVTTQCIGVCLRKNIMLNFYSQNGSYFGCLESTGHIHASRQRMQDRLYHTEFALNLGKRILQGKVKNQQVLLHRYARNQEKDISEEDKMIKICYGKMDGAESLEQLIGYEG